MKYFKIVIVVLIALFLIILPASATDSTIEPGNYIEFSIYAPGAQSIQFYVIGMNKFYVSNPDYVSTEKLSKKELEEYLKEYEYYVYNDKKGTFTIYLQIADDASAENHFSNGEYQLIVQHPGTDGIFNTIAEEAPGYGYTSGYNIVTNGAFRFNVPAIGSMKASTELIQAIKDGNDLSTTYKFTVAPVGSKHSDIIVVPSEQTLKDVSEEIQEEKEIQTEYPTNPIKESAKTPLPFIGIMSGAILGLYLIARKFR